MCRSQADRLELRLALFGFEGTHYTLTYDSVHLPRTFREAMATKRPSWPGHDDSMRGSRLTGLPAWRDCTETTATTSTWSCGTVISRPAVVRHLWRAGEVDDEPVLMPTGGYRRLAEYLTKERTDGIIIPIGRRPWNCSRSLSQQLPPPERWRDESGIIDIPDDVLWARRGERSNSFGAYAYASYIQSNSSFNLSRAPACAPARIQS